MSQWARATFPPGSRVGTILRSLAGRLGLRYQPPVPRVIAAYAKAVPDATFVQIGAHDGTALDPLRAVIRRTKWRGLMVEPVPYVFERLRRNVAGNPRLTLENVAIADHDGVKDFFHLRQARPDEEVWEFYDALGSFERDVVLSHRDLIPDIEDRLVRTEVPCVSFDTLCARNHLDRVNVIQIDTEGYDLVILGMIDLERYRPDIVSFESLHLDPDAAAANLRRFAAAGYETLATGMDTLAVRADVLASTPSLQRAFLGARDEAASERPA